MGFTEMHLAIRLAPLAAAIRTGGVLLGHALCTFVAKRVRTSCAGFEFSRLTADFALHDAFDEVASYFRETRHQHEKKRAEGLVLENYPLSSSI